LKSRRDKFGIVEVSLDGVVDIVEFGMDPVSAPAAAAVDDDE